jgi:hypothetical protein
VHTDGDALQPLAQIMRDQVRLYAQVAELSDAQMPSDAIRSVWNERQAMLSELERKLRGLGFSETAQPASVLSTSTAKQSQAPSAAQDLLCQLEQGENRLRVSVGVYAHDQHLSISTRAFLNILLARLKLGHERVAAVRRTLG